MAGFSAGEDGCAEDAGVEVTGAVKIPEEAGDSTGSETFVVSTGGGTVPLFESKVVGCGLTTATGGVATGATG